MGSRVKSVHLFDGHVIKLVAFGEDAYKLKVELNKVCEIRSLFVITSVLTIKKIEVIEF
jgi:hypothetical protein